MFLRTSSLYLALIVAACGSRPDDTVAVVPLADRIDCALDGVANFAKACVLEKAGGIRFVLHHPGGGFRRIDVAPDGTISAADGSAVAGGEVLPDGRFELTMGSDRYRLPPRK